MNDDNLNSRPKPTIAQYEKYLELKKGIAVTNVFDELYDLLEEVDFSCEIFEEDQKVGIKNPIGDILLPARFDDFFTLASFQILQNDYVVCVVGYKFGVSVANGTYNWYIEPEYDFIGYPYIITTVMKDKKWGIYNIEEKKFIIPLVCDEISGYLGFLFTNDIGYFIINGKYGVISSYGMHTEAIFEDMEKDPFGVVTVKYNGKWGFINENNEFTEDEDEAYYYFME